MKNLEWLLGALILLLIGAVLGVALDQAANHRHIPAVQTLYGRAPDGTPYCAPGAMLGTATLPSPSPCYFLGGRNAVRSATP